MKTKIHNGWEFEIETHDFDKKLNDIKIPKGWELWKPSDCWLLYENKELWKEFNLKDCWFFVFNPLYNGLVARFSVGSDGAGLYCDRDPSFAYSSLGIRLKRKVKK